MNSMSNESVETRTGPVAGLINFSSCLNMVRMCVSEDFLRA